ncbi:hypothetical protein ACKKBG_A09940 [Auxenochlorella protothecoides x Auxenochlorella symbiontica]
MQSPVASCPATVEARATEDPGRDIVLAGPLTTPGTDQGRPAASPSPGPLAVPSQGQRPSPVEAAVADAGLGLQELHLQLCAARQQAREAAREVEQARLRVERRDAQAAASERSEAALVAQLRSLASQLESTREQVATEHAEACSARRDAEAAAAQAQSREAVLASQVEEWRMRAQAGSMAQSELAAERKVALDSRLAVAVMQRERDAMRAALQEREAEATRQAARVAGLQGELGGARAALADLRLDLAEERRRALALADALARGACGDTSPGGRPGTPGQRALREAMSAARAELAEKEAQLAACMEDLMLERRRCAELHAQTLDQAMEIDDLHAEVAGLLDAGAARKADTLGGAGPGCDTPAVQQEVVELRDALEASQRVTQDLQRQKAGLEEEVLALTSRALEGQPRPPTDAESWLMGS